MIEIKNLYKTYGSGDSKVEALKDINLTIEKGDIYGIIGLSGAGKSSLVRCINLLERPDSGQVIINGVDLVQTNKNELRFARKQIGMVFQHFNLLMSKTVFDNVAFPLVVANKPRDYIEKRVSELLDLVGLSDKRNVYPAMLSGGQKQRIGIARAIVAEPELVICDEATSALDPATTKSILSLLKLINERLNITIIVITHEMEVIKDICNHVAILEDGYITEKGSVRDTYVNPKTSTGKEFFKSIDTELTSEVYLRAIDDNAIVLKTIFLGDRSTDPYICQMIRLYDVDVAILLGKIQQIEATLIGTLVIKVKGDLKNIDASIRYLQDNEVIVEVLHNGLH